VIEMSMTDLAQGSTILPAHDEMFHHRDVIGMTGIVIAEATAMSIKKRQQDTEGTGTTVTWTGNLRWTILVAGGTTESVMSVCQRDGTENSGTANETRTGYAIALPRGMRAIVRIADGPPPMTVMVEASERLVARENPTRRRTGTIARIVTENVRKRERRSLHGWTHTSLLLAATV
jgi:hypothetical protein